MKINRREIRKALAHYKESQKQTAAILKDEEIQSLFNQDHNKEAKALIEKRYPLGSVQSEREAGMNLAQVMTKTIPAGLLGGATPEKFFRNYKAFKGLLELAEKI